MLWGRSTVLENAFRSQRTFISVAKVLCVLEMNFSVFIFFHSIGACILSHFCLLLSRWFLKIHRPLAFLHSKHVEWGACSLLIYHKSHLFLQETLFWASVTLMWVPRPLLLPREKIKTKTTTKVGCSNHYPSSKVNQSRLL